MEQPPSHDSESSFFITRASLPPSSHAVVDLILKDLKIDARRLQSVLTAQADEAQVLERIYYKGKNQHRGALFWRRVVEIRRFCDRLQSTDVFNTVNKFRCSFFGPNAHQNPTLLKGSWTTFPDPQSVTNVKKKLTSCLSLVDKMYDQMVGIYRSFVISMQSGAFVQILLALVGIASRMRALTSELRDVLQLINAAADRTLLLIAPQPVNTDTHIQIFERADNLVSPNHPTPTSVLYASIERTHVPYGDTVGDDAETLVVNVGDSKPQQQGTSRVIVQRRKPAVIPLGTQQDSRRAGLEARSIKTKREKKKKLDEIDAIFGI